MEKNPNKCLFCYFRGRKTHKIMQNRLILIINNFINTTMRSKALQCKGANSTSWCSCQSTHTVNPQPKTEFN